MGPSKSPRSSTIAVSSSTPERRRGCTATSRARGDHRHRFRTRSRAEVRLPRGARHSSKRIDRWTAVLLAFMVGLTGAAAVASSFRGRQYIGTALVAFDASDGHVKWTERATSGRTLTRVSLDRGVVVTADVACRARPAGSPRVTAFDERTGTACGLRPGRRSVAPLGESSSSSK